LSDKKPSLAKLIQASSPEDFTILIFAGLLYAAALKYFVLPSTVILTGTEGIAAALSYYFDLYALFIILYACFQAALLAFAFLRMSGTFAFRSLIVIATVIIALAALPQLRFAAPENERMILVIFGGLLAGVAKAVAFQRHGSTGDEDILGAYFASKYLRPVGSILVVAAIVSTAFGLLMSLLKNGQFEVAINTLMYTCIYIFVSAETLNNLYRRFKLTMVVVVTRHEDKVGSAIRESLPYRTYTVQQGVGGHTGEPSRMLRTVVTHEELPDLIATIEGADPASFYYHHDIEGVSRRYYVPPVGASSRKKS